MKLEPRTVPLDIRRPARAPLWHSVAYPAPTSDGLYNSKGRKCHRELVIRRVARITLLTDCWSMQPSCTADVYHIKCGPSAPDGDETRASERHHCEFHMRQAA